MKAELAYIAYTEGYWQVWVYDEKSQQTRQVSFSVYDKNVVSWFPAIEQLPTNGSKKGELLINSVQGNLFRLNVDTGKEQQIKLSRTSFFDAMLSPDGKIIAFSYSGTGETDDSAIWMMDLVTQARRKLTNMQGLQHSPRWSEHGNAVYFASNAPGSTNGLWKVSLDGNKIQLLSNRHRNFDVIPMTKEQKSKSESSPLHESYLYSNNAAGNYEIWLKEPGKTVKNITEHQGLDKQPTLSPDQSHIVFTSTRKNGVPNLWLLDREKESLMQLTDHPRGARNSVWR